MLSTSVVSKAQYFRFSTEPDSFAVDVIRGLKSVELEATNKVAYDFRGAWDGSLTNLQKQKVIDICEKMRKRGMRMNPHYRYLFSLLTYSITQENADQEDIDSILAVMEHAVDNYSDKEVVNLSQTLTYFFARGYLFFSKYNKLTTEGGQYSLKLLEDVKPSENVQFNLEEQVEEDDPEEDIISEDDEMFQANDFGDNDDWASDSSNDGWGSDDDSGWGSNDEGDWSSDSDLGFLPDPDEQKEEVFERKTFQLEKTDYVAQYKLNDFIPEVGGAVIELQGMEFKVSTPFDTIRIKNVKGSLMLRDGVFVGESGLVEWPGDIRGTDGVLVDLTNFYFEIKNPVFKSSRARMLFPKMFEDSLAGAFEFKSLKRRKKSVKPYPRFTSFYSDKVLNLPYDNMSYKGGFGLWGGQMVGTSISKIPSTLEVRGADPRSMKTRAELYYFNNDSTIKTDLAELTIYHGIGDSIYHPAVKVKLDAGKNYVSIYKDKGDYKNTYYYSSFFKMEFKADRIRWDIESDSLDISIMNGAQMIPAVFESEDFFNSVRFAKMSGLSGFHPIRLVVNYARKIHNSSYNVMELVSTYDIKQSLIFTAVEYLHQNSYITYDKETGDITVLRKAFHYIMSVSKKKDYDNFLISSISPDEPNASLNFDRKEMDVRGVRRVNITPDNEVYLEPDDKVLTLIEDKGMKFNGMVNAEGFQYKGKEFVFDYERYLVDMRKIDSIRIQVQKEEGEERTPLAQHLETTSGVLYINHPNNKAGLKKYTQYPYFESDSEAVVYFDSKEILDGNYDRSVYFLIPPFKSDTVGQESIDSLSFTGTFYSGGILPPIQEVLHIMPDRSLGFKHTIPSEGYNLYKGDAVLYDSLNLDFGGLTANGRVTYQTAEIHSDKFTFYMDSVTAEGQESFMKEGQIGSASYPQAEMKHFRMLWLPNKDSMYIENLKDPFMFYEQSASLDGKANITGNGVYGSGTMFSRGSKTISQEYHFESDKYSGRHAHFEVLTDVPGKPAMEGDDVKLKFDLTENQAKVQPEEAGVAAISFPYSQMKTSMSNATWYLDSAKIYMEKPEQVDIKYSYFYTTREDLDSLAFNASGAYYDMETYDLNIYGIPYINVADARLIPEGNQTTILENSVLTPFTNMKLEMDSLNQYHHFSQGNITIISRKKFEGDAVYHLVNSAGETFDIVMRDFAVRVVEQSNGELDSMTTAYGHVGEDLNVMSSPGFFYKGEVELQAANKKLYKEGYISPYFKTLGRYDYWIEYNAQNDTANVYIDIANSKTENGEEPIAGLYYDLGNDELYMSYLHEKRTPEDETFFKAEGMLSYEEKSQEFIIEDSVKHNGNSYVGKSFIYNDQNGQLSYEGKVDLLEQSSQFNVQTAIVGTGIPETGLFRINAMMMMDFKISDDLMKMMAKDILKELDNTDVKEANGSNSELVLNLAQLTDDESARKYESKLLKEYTPLYKIDDKLEKTLVLTNVKMKRNQEYAAWYSTSKIGLSHSFDNDINAMLDGFLEVKKDDEGVDVFNLFFEVNAGTWYYFSYSQGRLLVYSSSEDFNERVVETSKVEKVGFGEYAITLGDEFEVLDYVEGFRSKYLGINTPYKIQMPAELQLEDDEFSDDNLSEDDEFVEEETEEEFNDEGNESSEEKEETPLDNQEPVKEDEDDGF
ncbi:hypothetical protein [Reichenbachiella versicolor]|uniref:hypothetical protein n=1 Tax=Reichenbachiella versicolor TaxID=1821036 RepID=UPI000D6DCF6A|nr:hypothetical protein [Reichenbachiella versicolor]